MEIVIVPAWKRADFLAATLRRLLAADDQTIRYWIAVDRRYSTEVMREAQRFCEHVGPRRSRHMLRRHAYRGNSFNVLTAYKEAVECSPDLVHLVEEDVFVGSDYFDFHRSAHKLVPDAFCVSGARNQNHAHDPPPRADRVYIDGQYQSVAVSFRPAQLAPVLAHATPVYYRNPIAYCQQAWPGSKINVGCAEQDGLLNRFVEAGGLSVVYPWAPRAYHAGFVGYHRAGVPLAGRTQERATALLAMSSADLNKRAHSYPDHQVVNLDAKPGPVTAVEKWPNWD